MAGQISTKATKLSTNTSANGPRKLFIIFVGWKLLLVLVACLSPGPGYDTSTQILLDQYSSSSRSRITNVVKYVILRLTRWDGIYFASNAARGHVHEQEWAFSWVLARMTSAFSTALLSPLPLSDIAKHALAGIIISHISHLLSVFVLYRLTASLIPAGRNEKRNTAFRAACLHIISPAGLFLSAPSGESTFALFNFLGMLCYVHAMNYRCSGKDTLAAVACTVAAGINFGLASTIRSNGLLSGIIFAWDALTGIIKVRTTLQDGRQIVFFAATIAAGIFVAIGFTAPQLVAYIQYCTNGNTRPWCDKFPPSIYRWVQEHYWGVGFLRYWTMNNLPLFLLAGPMLVMLLYTGYIALMRSQVLLRRVAPKDARQSTPTDAQLFGQIMPRFALPQLVLTVMAATSFHVQIINRICSGYPVWYIVLAIATQDTSAASQRTNAQGKEDRQDPGARSEEGSGVPILTKHARAIVRAMVIYAIVQGGLYACFLPPA